EAEEALDPEVKGWLAFARQKLDELSTLTAALGPGEVPEAAREALAANRRAIAARRVAQPGAPEAVQGSGPTVTAADRARAQRASGYAERARVQQRELGLPLLPTTTIGSFPQTADIRRARRAHDAGDMG